MDIGKWLKKNSAEESTTSDTKQSREEDGDNVGHAGTVDVTLASVNVSATSTTIVEASKS